MAMLRGHVDMLVAVAGVFLFLPELARALLFPFEPNAQTVAEQMAQLSAYLSANSGKLLLVAIVQAFGQAAIVILLTDRDRPTVAEGLKRGLPILPWYFLTTLILGLILFVGLIALILPAAYLLGRIGISAILTTVERIRNPFAAIGRTWRLTAANGWRAFFLIALVWVVGWIVARAALTIVGLITLVAAGQTETSAIILGVTSALFATALSLVLLLIYVAIYRQLGREVSVPSTRGT